MKRLSLWLTVFLIPSLGFAKTLDRVAAVVGEEPILLSDVQNFRRELQSSRALAGIYRLEPEKTSDKALLDRMIEDKIISQAAKALDAVVSESEIENQISTIAKQNRISKAQLEASLVREGISPDSYRRNIRSQIEKRNVFERELRRSGGGPSDAELRALYEKRAGKEYKVSLGAFLAPKGKAALAAKKNEISSILKKYKTGELSLKATESTLDTNSLGWLQLDSLNPALQKELVKKDRGDFVGPLLIEGKLTVLLVEDTRSGSEEGFQKMKEEIVGELAGKDFERRYQSWLERKKREMNILINL